MKKWFFPSIIVVILIVPAIFYGYSIHDTKKAATSTDNSKPPIAVNWQQNGKDGKRIVHIIKGHLSKTMKGVVDTDTNCEADAQGISHCQNIITLQNQQKITVIHIHNMKHYPCLDPKQSVTVKPLNDSWAEIS